VLPLMLATVVADIVYSAVNDDSLMTEKLRRRGLHVGRHYGVDPFSSARVGEIMTANVISLPSTATVGEARARFAGGGHGAYPIVDGDDRLRGIVGRGDILGNDCGDDEPLMSHASSDVVTVSATDRAQTALRLMIDESVEHLPVVSEGKLIGICTRTDLLKVRQRQLQHEQRDPGLALHTWSLKSLRRSGQRAS